MRRQRRQMAVLSEMNLTNLLDTTLVLILALLMVAPMMKQGIAVQLPDAPGQQIDSHPKTITISIAPADGVLPDRIYIDNKRYSVEDMAKEVYRQKSAEPADADAKHQIGVSIEADRKVKFEIVAQVIGALKDIGVNGVDLPTEPTEFRGEKAGSKTADESAQ